MILLAPDKLKGTFTAAEAAARMAAGIRRVWPDAVIDLCPLSDGGEGFVEALLAATGGTRITTRVIGPRPDQTVEATWGFLGDPSPIEVAEEAEPSDATPSVRGTSDPTTSVPTPSPHLGVSGGGGRRYPAGRGFPPDAPPPAAKIAVIEMAAASGLWRLSPEDRNPELTTSFGTGQLLLAAAAAGATSILLGLGGSATNDAGLGLCQAVGHTLLRHDGQPISPHDPLAARDLPDIYLIKRGRGSPLDRIPITVACDVTNPLAGPTGASHVFAPQKGATPKQVQWLDAQLAALAARCHKEEEAQSPGAGAAGGLGWAMLSFFNATLTPGAQLVFDYTNLQSRIRQADLVITAEGAFDASSLHNKLPTALARACQREGKPCHLLAGRIEAPTSDLFASAHALDGRSLENAAESCARMLVK
jgi:glycerate kinase